VVVFEFPLFGSPIGRGRVGGPSLAGADFHANLTTAGARSVQTSLGLLVHPLSRRPGRAPWKPYLAGCLRFVRIQVLPGRSGRERSPQFNCELKKRGHMASGSAGPPRSGALGHNAIVNLNGRRVWLLDPPPVRPMHVAIFRFSGIENVFDQAHFARPI